MSDPAALRRPTIRDVAARAGVSKSLVALVYAEPSRVSPERTRRVLDAATELGFRPNVVARSLAGAAGFVTVFVTEPEHPRLVHTVSTARGVLSDGGVPSLVSAIARGGVGPDTLTLTLMRDLRTTGVLVVGALSDFAPVMAFADEGTRLVVANAIPPRGAVSAVVRGDDDAGIRLAVDHLVSLGHRRIAYVGGIGTAVAEARLTAYRKAMIARGLGADIRIGSSDSSLEGGRSAAGTLLDGGNAPTAVVAGADLAAIGVMAAATDRGVRLAVTGYDNSAAAALPQVSLTSIEPGSVEVGRLAATLLMSGGPIDGETLVAPSLVVRDSSTAPASP